MISQYLRILVVAVVAASALSCSVFRSPRLARSSWSAPCLANR